MSDVFAGGNTHDDSSKPANQDDYGEDEEEQAQKELSEEYESQDSTDQKFQG
jgi:hypothetical protein